MSENFVRCVLRLCSNPHKIYVVVVGVITWRKSSSDENEVQVLYQLFNDLCQVNIRHDLSVLIQAEYFKIKYKVFLFKVL